MKQILFFALLIAQSCFPFLLFAQPVNPLIGDVTLPAPNAAALGKYGDIPVSYYTGVPNIGIPIYNVQQGPISLPISLGYHASGIKVGEVASWVGLGWSLNAGGMITRTVQGLPDDQTGGYYHSASELDIEDVEDLLAITQGSLDTEPDLFAFNFAGYSGKFYFDSDQNPQLVPIQDIQIEVILNNAVFTTFILTDHKGIRYIFGKDPDSSQSAIESSLSTGQSSSNYSSWYLIRIESSDSNHAISLTYEPDRYGYRTLATCRYIGKNCVDPEGQSFFYATECTSDSYEAGFPNNRYTATNISGYRVAQIATTTDTINFLATTTRQDLDNNQHVQTDKKLLDAIEINSGNFCKKFTFSYDYFEDSAHSSVSEGKRLRLESLQESDCTQTDTIPSYRFDYEGDGSFPFRLSKATDHWGFYNGANQNNSLAVAVPPTIVYLPDNTEKSFGSANKETDTTATSTYIKQGVLNKITYPTGGFTEFTFEANEVVAPVSDTIVRDTFDLQQSSVLDDMFCGQVIQSDTFRFKNQGIIDSSIMRLHMASVETGNCTEPIYQQYLIEALLGGNVVGSISFDTVGMADSIAVHLDLGDLADFEVDSLYTFRLTTNECWGRFEIEYTSIIGMPALKKVGGLRIKKIRSHDGISVDNDIIREYDYSPPSSPGSSSGQLTAMPIYGQYMTGTHIVDDGTGGDETLVNMVAFHEHSIVPISSFQGFHLAYRSVKEIFKDGSGNAGYTTYEYNVDVDQNALQSNYPFIPHQIQLKNGPVLEEIKYNSSGTIVSQLENDDFNGTFTRNGQDVIYKVAELASCPPGTGEILSKFVFISSYIIKSGAYLVSSTSSMLDGVTTVTHYSYDPDQTHLMPVDIQMTNSDGKDTRRLFTFPTDSVGTAVYDSMVVRNIITPISEQVWISSGFIEQMFDGTFTEYELFGGEPYPAARHRFEGTWDGNGGFNGNWVPQVSMSTYVNGYPTIVTKAGWSPDTLSWTAAGLIDHRKFGEDYFWDYEYHPGTRMVKKITDIDGQFVEYAYDDLMRLDSVKARNNKVITSFEYAYQPSGNDYNYIKTTTSFEPVSGSSLTDRTTFEYLDGLGRPLQTVEQAYSPDQLDIVKALKYDKLGRVAVTYEPFESGAATGAFVADIPGNVDSTLTTYEDSPLNRTVSITPPSWHTTFIEYGTNTDVVHVPGGHNYTTEVLFTETVIEPDGSGGTSGNRTTTFTDRKGRLILSRRQQGTSGPTADTWYLYDDKDRVTMVIPPGADETSDELTYRYTYTGDDLVLSKKLPGQDSLMHFRYNDRDLLTYSKDGNLDSLGLWLHTHYDAYGRIAETGFYEAPAVADGNTVAGFDELLTFHGYGSTGIETGKLTAVSKKILGSDNDFLVNAYQYDAYGRIGSTLNSHHLHDQPDGDIFIYEYDFADNLLREERTHKANSTTRQIDQRWTYDHAGRNTAHYLSLDLAAEVQLCQMDYTVKDELKQKQVGYTGSGFLQTVDYSYLNNGFLHRINAIDTAGTGNTSDDLFHLELRYDQNLPALNRQFNGNIGQVLWQVKGSTAKLYKLQYDYLNRLTYGDYKEFINGVEDTTVLTNYLTTYTYDDARGNFSTVNRAGVVNGSGLALIDLLHYDYYAGTNRLKSIDDTAPTMAGRVLGFYPGDETGNYLYDKNGNLTHDPYKELQLTYNYLNLPDTLTHNSNGGKVTWLYDAEGQKLQKKSEATQLTLTGAIPSGLYQAREITADGEINGNGKVELQAVDSIKLTPGFTIEVGAEFSASIAPAAGLTHDYVGNIEYRNGALDAIYLEEGRVNFTESGSRFEYSLTDHLGNTRITFADLNANGQVDESEILQENHYYPFGMEMDGPWKGNLKQKNRYRFNQIERNGDLALNLDLAEFRGYDPAIGRWLHVDPLTEFASDHTPYRFGFNNPMLYSDPLGLFESRDSARAYKRAHELRGRIRQQSDGSWAIENRKNHSSTSKDAELGVVTAALASAPKDGYHSRQSLLYSPERREPYTGLWGQISYMLTDGQENGMKYDRDGYPLRIAPVGGMPLASPGGGLKAGITFTKLIKGLKGTSVKQGVKFVETGGNRVVEIYRKLRRLGWQLESGATSGGVKTLLNPKTGERIMFRQSQSGGYRGYDTIFQPIEGGKNVSLFFK